MNFKLIDFGCGELLKESTYKTFTGTKDYTCPEVFKTGIYYGKPPTVYSLRVLLFAMLCGKFPNCNNRSFINEKIWYKDGLTEEINGRQCEIGKVLGHGQFWIRL